MEPKQAVIDLWKKGYFEKIRTNKEITKKLADDYKVSPTNLTATLKNCKKFIRKMGRAGWRQTKPFDETDKKENRNETKYFALLDIHPRIQKASQKLFLDGHYPQAIEDAFKAVNIFVKEKSERRDLDGKKLMLEVFSKDNPILALNGNSTISEKDEQEGFMHLFAGAIQGIRNPNAHDEIIQRDQKATLQYLAFASLLCRTVDKSKKVR